MKKVVFTLLALTFIGITAVAQDSQTQYNFLRIPVSAHAAALGGDNITIIEDDPTLTFHNPALLAGVSDKTLNLNFITFMKECVAGSASFSKILTDKATIAALAQYVNYGSMKETDANNTVTGEFTAKDIALNCSFSYMLWKNVSGGITAKFVNSYIGSYSSIAVGVDLGINYYDPKHEWSLSLVAKNLGGELKAYDEEYGKMPLDVQAGVSKRFGTSPIRLSATFADLNHWDYKFINHCAVGIDFLLGEQFYVSGGYNFRRANEMKIIASGEEKGSSHGAGITLGAGLQLERFKVQAAYGKHHVSAGSLLVNLSYSL